VPSALRYFTVTRATLLNLFTLMISTLFCMDRLWGKTRCSSILSDAFFHFFSMAWTAQVGTEHARRGGFNRALHLARTMPSRGEGGQNPPVFLKKKFLFFASHRWGEVFFNLSIHFILSYILLNIYNIIYISFIISTYKYYDQVTKSNSN
jgi:hypothetical protein